VPYRPDFPKSTVAARMRSWQPLLTRGSSWIDQVDDQAEKSE